MGHVTALFYPIAVNPGGSVLLDGCNEFFGLDDVVLMVRAPYDARSGPLFDGDIVDHVGWKQRVRVAFRSEVGWDSFEIGATSPDDASFILSEDGPQMQVIGNIYENPELLA